MTGEQLTMDVDQPRTDARRKRRKDLPYEAILFLRRHGWSVERISPKLHKVRCGCTSAESIDDEELCFMAHSIGWKSN